MANRLCSKIGTCDALHAEMRGMYEGLKIARSLGFSHLIVKSDSKLLVDMITNNCKINGATLVLLPRINLIWHVQINHTLRECNKCANWLTSHCLTNDSFLSIVLEVPPKERQSILFDNISGTCVHRNIHLILSFSFTLDFAFFLLNKKQKNYQGPTP
jgi:hypothetical protein